MIFIAEPITHLKRPLVRPHDAHHFSLRMNGGSILRHADTIEHQFDTICGGGGGVCRGHRTTASYGPQRELPLARLVIRRQTSAHAQRNETLRVQPRSGILVISFTLQRLADDNGLAPHYRRAPPGGCCSGGEAATLLSTGFWARNHQAL